MIAYGTHEAESYLVKSDNLQMIGLESKSDIARPWDILQPKDSLEETDNAFFYSYDLKGKQKYTHIMHDSGRVGVFLKVFGYNSNPNYIELLFWIISLIGGIALWRSFYRPATKLSYEFKFTTLLSVPTLSKDISVQTSSIAFKKF